MKNKSTVSCRYVHCPLHMRLERKQNDVSIHEVREWELIFYEVHYDLAITQHVQQKDTITTKYPPLQKQEEKKCCWEHFFLKVSPFFLVQEMTKEWLDPIFYHIGKKCSIYIV